MADSRIVREWLAKADEDFDFANSVINDTPFYAQICFHFHQAAEKYLKAFIIAHDLDFLKIHDLPVLLKACLDNSPELEQIMDDCKVLNRYYIDARYPVHWPSKYEMEEALKAKSAAENVRDAVVGSLASHSHPPF
jgi:HEPN domain-containing protein